MLIDASTGELMWSETESGGEVPASVGFAPGGDQIVALWTDGGVRVYGSRGGAIDATYVPRHEASVESGPSLATFAPGGRIVALAERKDVVLWAPEDGTVSRTFRHDAPVRAVAFSPDGRTLAAGSSDATIQLWDVADGTLEATLTGHQGPIETVSFSPSGGFIVSAARDGTARVWNREGEQIQVYQAGGLFVTSAMFSPDGTHVLVGVVIGQDTVPDVVEHDVEVRSTTRVYSCEICLRFDELLHLAESRITRGFTPEERATYLSVDT